MMFEDMFRFGLLWECYICSAVVYTKSRLLRGSFGADNAAIYYS